MSQDVPAVRITDPARAASLSFPGAAWEGLGQPGTAWGLSAFPPCLQAVLPTPEVSHKLWGRQGFALSPAVLMAWG